ncbi:cobalt-zinc-cadmium efflux system outer membrane protein [Collimonas sp. PA-H2]|uniref:TolC family protein n=1 Tax=Collimonas sp. PA-H2 TaxID=1881062 RepID=UPI000BFA9F58|nr:TolC family protein [Collimonas sp. PA-H2]PFH11944.1 cobalt-zinc-cadmium efflux system outer membrane protein [Collimonas sp. PA-H2]
MHKFFLPLGFAVLVCQSSLAQDAVPASAPIAEPQPVINYKLPRLGSEELAGPLTLQQALRQAFKSNPELAAAALEVKAVEASILQAGARPNPQVSALLEDTRKATRTSTVQLNQTLELGGKRDARIKAAEKGRDAAQADYLTKRADVRGAVVGAYFAALEAQENLQLLQNSLQLAQRASEIAAKRVAAGKVAPIEATKARVAEAGVRVELQQANSSLNIARRALAVTWGDMTPAFSTVDGHINDLPALPDLAVALERLQNSPAFVKTRVEVERRQALVQLERSRRIPDVTVSIGGKRVEENRQNQMIFGLSVPIPVFDRNQGNLQEALQRADKARDELRGAQLKLDGELRDAYERLKLGRQQVAAFQGEILPAAQNTYEITSKGFELGKFSFLEVLDAQRVLFQAKSQALRALAETHRAATEIERVAGAFPSTDSL